MDLRFEAIAWFFAGALGVGLRVALGPPCPLGSLLAPLVRVECSRVALSPLPARLGRELLGRFLSGWSLIVFCIILDRNSEQLVRFAVTVYSIFYYCWFTFSFHIFLIVFALWVYLGLVWVSIFHLLLGWLLLFVVVC